MTDKELFSIMVHYHPAIVGRLIHNGLCVKKESNIEVLNNSGSSSKKKEFVFPYKILTTDTNGVSKVIASSLEMRRNETLLEVSTHHPEIFNDIDSLAYCSNFESGNTYFCPYSVTLILLAKHYTEIDYISLPKGQRIPTSGVAYYINILQRQVECMKQWGKTDLHFTSYSFSYKDYGIWPHEKWYDYILKNGFCAYLPLYSEVEWDFDMVEKYKDIILWLNLLEDSNLLWTEERLLQFDNYIPHRELRTSKPYCNSFIPTKGYGNIGKLSNHYIESHKDVINWAVFVSTANFSWSVEDLKYFYEYANQKKRRWGMYELSRNDKFIWTPDILKEMIYLDPNSLECCIENPKLRSVLYMIPNHKDLVLSYNNNPDFWLVLKDGGKQPHGAYSDIFTVNQITENKDIWDKQIDDKLSYIQRTPDTNYHHHKVFTMWDYFLANDAIKLTYNLCKCLQQIDITVGGEYVLEDGYYEGESNLYIKHNGLSAFSNHHFASNDDLIKVCEDEVLLDVLIGSTSDHKPNTDVVDYLIEKFFLDYNISDYISIVNKLSDWNIISN